LNRTDTPAHRKLLERNGQPIPEGMAVPDDVARTAMERLPHGPIHNWGEGEDTIGMSANSPAQRRAKIVMVEDMTRAYTGQK
jgi:hypothetical protein